MDYLTLIESVLSENKRIASQNSYIAKWNSWYRGNVSSFHNYKVYNGTEFVKQQKLSLQMAKRGCEDWASLLMNEHVDIVIKDNEKLKMLLRDFDFWNKANKAVEFAFALSMSALVVNLGILMDDAGNVLDGDVNVDVYNANRIVPITIEHDKITECAFIVENTNETIITMHLLQDNGNYEIVVVKENKNTHVRTMERVDTGYDKRMFVIISPNLVNNLDVDSPYPISIFANAIDTLKAIDNKYDSYNNEFILGRKRVYISAKAQKVNRETGAVERTFDPQDVVFYQLPEDSMSGDKPFVKTDTDQLRAMEHKAALQDELNMFASKIGLGNDYYNFEKGRVMTATQVISEKSDTFRNKRKHEILLERALVEIVEAIIFANNTFATTNPQIVYDNEIEIKFDDSIIEDKETQKTSDRTDVTNGIMSKVEFRMKWYNETEEEATALVNKYYGDVSLQNRINAFLPALQVGAMTAEQFVNMVYVDAPNKPELITAIQQSMQGGAQITPEDLLATGITTQPNAQQQAQAFQQQQDLGFTEGE